ncbi:Inhibitor of growth 5 [Paramuricea clavata]|uniref:Inhibitor of growth 5 n=1 Tax=Paramuricea clavata TaxID=317549 RepID=A0A6S7IRD3_PARCT|nr:Inhibitor of growth 5 [Paramuricea clavata]
MEEANNMMEYSVLGEDEIQNMAKMVKKAYTSSRQCQRGNVPNGMKRPNYKFEENDETNDHRNQRLLIREIMTGMFSRSIATSVKEQIAAMLYELDKDEIDVNVQPVLQQTNSTDSGVFALAFATAICLGYKGSHCHFDMEKMWSHLSKCMEEEGMEMFPSAALWNNPRQ